LKKLRLFFWEYASPDGVLQAEEDRFRLGHGQAKKEKFKRRQRILRGKGANPF